MTTRLRSALSVQITHLHWYVRLLALVNFLGAFICCSLLVYFQPISHGA
jgi:hypothetical protein